MKGLLVKDFKLMKTQKNFFLAMIVIAIGVTVVSYDVSFVLGFLPFVISLFTLSTISYDEFDNGSAFLFTLPINRTGYAVEKYCFGLLISFASWILAMVIAVVIGGLGGIAAISDIVRMALMTLLMVCMMQAVTIPFQLKFGRDKGKIAMLGAIGIVFIISMIVVKGIELLGMNLDEISYYISTVNIGVFFTTILLIAVVLFFVSMKISIFIMKKKEF